MFDRMFDRRIERMIERMIEPKFERTGFGSSSALRLIGLSATLPRVPHLGELGVRRYLVAVLAEDFETLRTLSASVDVSKVENLAERFGLLPVLADRLERFPGLVPEATRQRMADELAILAARNAILLSDALELAEIFRDGGFPHVFLKGTALIARTHPRLLPRHTDDIDVLLPREPREEVARALEAHGARIIRDPKTSDPFNAITRRGTRVDLHFGMRYPDLERENWTSTETLKIQERPLRISSLETLVIHLCHHVVRHHEHRPRYLPRHLADLRALGAVRRPSRDFSLFASFALLELLEESRRESSTATGLASILFPTRHTVLPQAVYRKLRRWPKVRLVDGQLLEKLQRHTLFKV